MALRFIFNCSPAFFYYNEKAMTLRFSARITFIDAKVDKIVNSVLRRSLRSFQADFNSSSIMKIFFHRNSQKIRPGSYILS